MARLIKSEPQCLDEIMKPYSDLLDRLGLEVNFSDIRNTTAIGAALLPTMDFYKINNDNE